MHTITIHDVSPEAFQRLLNLLERNHDFEFEQAEDGKFRTQGGELQGALHYDGQGDLKVEIGSHPRLTTPGYLFGYLIDRLGECPAPTDAPEAGK